MLMHKSQTQISAPYEAQVTLSNEIRNKYVMPGEGRYQSHQIKNILKSIIQLGFGVSRKTSTQRSYAPLGMHEFTYS